MTSTRSRRIIHDSRTSTPRRSWHRASGRCGRALALLVIDQVIPLGNGPHQSKHGDVLMFVVHGAQERTAAEFETLLDEAGFAFQRVIPTTSQWSIVEAVRR